MSFWNLKDQNGDPVEPLIYSNGKSQEDVTREIIETLKTNDVVFVLGGVGSGKSAIALQQISYSSSGIIVVPTKILEHQYVNDYCTNNKYHFEVFGRKLPVNFMFGKGNFICQFLVGTKYCTHPDAPCSRKLEKKETRISAASECKYWSPIYSADLLHTISSHLPYHTPIHYDSINGENIFFLSHNPCEYYNQFLHYTKPGAIIMNLAKWEIETWIGRKTSTSIEIIDEADMFLDGLTYRKTISPKFFDSLKSENTVDKAKIEMLEKDYYVCIGENGNYEGPLNDSITKYLSKFVGELEEENGRSINLVSKLSLILNHPEITYVQIEKEHMTLFLTRPDIVFSELKNRSGKIILMSATVQSPKILSSVFKLDNIPLIEAEPNFPGTLKIMCTSKEIGITYSDWIKDETRTKYYQLLEKIIEKAERPTLIQVHALKYVPTLYKDKLNKGFINGVSWSTVTDRGVDYPDEQCRSIIITKFPIPDITDIVFKVLRQTLGEKDFWRYVQDIANRDLIQQCGRAVRHKNDWCQIWSPDRKVLTNLWQLWKGTKKIIQDNIEMESGIKF